MSTHLPQIDYFGGIDGPSPERLSTLVRDPKITKIQQGVIGRIVDTLKNGWNGFWDLSESGWWAEKEQSKKRKAKLESLFSGLIRKPNKPHWPNVKGVVDGKTCIITQIPNGYFIALHVNAYEQSNENGDGIERIRITSDGQLVPDKGMDLSRQENIVNRVLANFIS